MRPYFEARGVALYHADARDLLPCLPAADRVIVTDPVWPNAHPDLAGSTEPFTVFRSTARLFPLVAGRAVVQLGCDSDPRFLRAIPKALPFLRACWIRRSPPGYKGPILIGADVAYVFGHARLPRGQRVFAGEGEASSRGRRPAGITHPCPRNEQGVAWLLRQFVPTGASVVDPFVGSGTTLVCASRMGIESIGIEVDERWCEQAARRLDNELRQGTLLA